MGQHGLVGLKNHRVFIGIAIEFFRDGAQGVTAHHVVVLGFGLGLGDRHLVVHTLHAGNVAAAQGDFFFGRLGGGRAPHGHFALAAIKRDLQVFQAQVLSLDIGGNGLRRLGIQGLRRRGRRCGCLGGLAAKKFFTGFFDKTKQTHGEDSFLC